MDGDFDKSAFTSADLRNLTRIETGSKKPKLLTSHPKESYTLTPGEDKLVTLEITDPAKFWSISNTWSFGNKPIPTDRIPLPELQGYFSSGKVYRTITVGPDKKTRQSSNDARNGSSERLRTLPRKEEEKELK